jgi:hypothetical protein
MLPRCGGSEPEQTTERESTLKVVANSGKSDLAVDQPPDRPEPSSAYHLVEEFVNGMRKARRSLARKGKSCRMEKVWIGGPHGGIFDRRVVDEYNGDGVLISRLGENWLIVLRNRDEFESIISFLTEKLLIEGMSKLEGGPAKYATVSFSGPVLRTEPDVSTGCLVGLYTLYVGQGDNRLSMKYSPHESPQKRLGGKGAARVIAALQRFHNSGFAHGNIGPGSILEMDGGIVFVGIGQATPFIDEKGEHVTDRTTRRRHQGPLIERSPWHLESDDPAHYRSTRRDDLFRVAETFFFLEEPRYSHYRWWYPKEKEFAEFKRDVPNWPGKFPEIFRDFYVYTLSLEYDSTPDYARWIHLFNEYEE